MNVVLPARGGLPAVSAVEAPCTVLAFWRVVPGAVMVLARAHAAPAASGSLRLAGPQGSRGVFRAETWSGEAEAGGGAAWTILAALRLPAAARLDAGATLILQGEADDDTTRFAVTLPAEADTPENFGERLAAPGRRRAAPLARFLLEMLEPAGGRRVPAADAMLRAFLARAATPDGCIEIMLGVPECCAMLQGWGAGLPDAVRVILAGAEIARFDALAGRFPRTDVTEPAVGVMVALPPQALPALAATEQVFVLSEDGLHSRSIVSRRLLEPRESLGHLRHMAPKLQCAAPMRAVLDEALRPRFDGRDTLSGNTHPVRAALDYVAAAPGAGLYLAGWIYDPGRMLAAVQVRDAAGLAASLDTAWTRVLREDVVAAFAGQPGFPAPRDRLCGFAAWIGTPDGLGSGAQLHLEFRFHDGETAFLPIAAADATQPAVRARLPGEVDLHKPSGMAIVAQHAAPFLAAIRPGPAPAPRIVVPLCPDRPQLILVPLPTLQPPRAFLAECLLDPPGAGEQLVLVCGPDWSEAACAQLAALARFYGVPAAILAVDVTPNAVVALQAAAALPGTADILLQGQGVTGVAPGWRAGLRQALAQAPAALFACPTLLYEDWSIRYAGRARLRFHDAAPYAETATALAGMPAGIAPAGMPRETGFGTLACCLLRPQAGTAGAAGAALLTEGALEADFFARLRAAGGTGLWVPQIRAWAPEAEAGAEPARQSGRLIDGWVLRRLWHTTSAE